MSETRFIDIAERVEASMCMSYSAGWTEGRMEARISKGDWDALLTMIGHRALWLVAEDGNAVLKAERTRGDWVTLISEQIEGPFSHIIEPSGIALALALPEPSHD